MQPGRHLVPVPKPNDYCFCGSQKKYKNCCRNAIVEDRGIGKGMRLVTIAGHYIFRPQVESENRVKRLAEAHLRQRFTPGEYTAFADVDAILKHQIDFYGDRFDQLVPQLASRNCMDFLMDQYDQASKVDRLHTAGTLRGEAESYWLRWGPTYMRSLKYMAERITMLAPPEDEAVPHSKLVDVLDEAVICAEQLVLYCILSDQTRIFRESSKITVQEPGGTTYFDHEVIDSRIENLRHREREDRLSAKTIFDQPLYESRVTAHAAHLDVAMNAHVGATYTEALQMLYRLRQGVRPNRVNFPTVFVDYQAIVKQFARAFNKPESVVSTVLSGFMLTQEKMCHEGRDYWNPQFHYRAFRRGMFLMPHETGPHLAWGSHLFDEAVTILTSEVCFGQFPNEWRTADVDARLGDIGRERGTWFEEQVQRNLSLLGINGVISRESLGQGRHSLAVPVGELDLIGWSARENSLILIECKMLQHGSEPKKWKNHIDSFTVGGTSFVKKLDRKFNWIADNARAVGDALRSEGLQIDNEPRAVCAAFITYSPSPASYFIPEFPCISLSEFIQHYRSVDCWPYDAGVRSVHSSTRSGRDGQ